jgi:pimeloyl-ACP methyl ester carboxylesterase
MQKRSTHLPGRIARSALLLIWGLTACTPAAWLPASPAATPAAAGFLQPCQLSVGPAAGGECGVLSVPEDRGHPDGKRIFVAVARLKAVSRTPRSDPLFLIAGGPGQAATQVFLPVIGRLARIRQDRDIVMVDQRGTGSSNPLTCSQAGLRQEPAGDPASFSPTELVKACLASLPGDPRFYTTRDFVQDLEQVRQSLGYGQIDLLGVSYGTRAALEYLRAFPDHVRALILDGAAPPDWPVGVDAAQDAQAAIDATFARCAQDTACRTAFPDLRQEFQALFAGLDRQPRPVTLPDPVSGAPVHLVLTHAIAASTVYALSYSSQTAALIPLLVHTAAAGDDTRLAAEGLILQRQTAGTVADGLYFSVVCAEDVPFYPQTAASIASYLPDGSARLKEECAAWPHAGSAAQTRLPVRSDVPTLLLSGSADPVTPPQNALRIAKYLPNSLPLVAQGFGHNVAFLGCFPHIAADFLNAGSVKGLDAACVSAMRPDPFFINFSGPTP